MHLSFLFIFSGVMILLGCLGIMLMFVVEGTSLTSQVIIFSMLIGISITCLNLFTFPPQAVLAKIIAYLLGAMAVIGAILNKKKYIFLAKCIISLSIILGLTQLILIY